MAQATVGLSTTRIKRAELLDILRSNRDTHIDDYTEAFNNYQTAFRVRLEEIADDLDAILKNQETVSVVEASKDLNTRIGLDRPKSYEEEYDKAIRRLELSADDHVTLTDAEFSQFVFDEWHWKNEFVRTSAMYKG